MLIRIVKMHFKVEKVEAFLTLFERYKSDIRNTHGCRGLELYQDQDKPQLCFTYSLWDSEDHLDDYRKSELFKKVWPATKLMFKEKAEAWSVNKIVSLP